MGWETKSRERKLREESMGEKRRGRVRSSRPMARALSPSTGPAKHRSLARYH